MSDDGARELVTGELIGLGVWSDPVPVERIQLFENDTSLTIGEQKNVQFELERHSAKIVSLEIQHARSNAAVIRIIQNFKFESGPLVSAKKWNIYVGKFSVDELSERVSREKPTIKEEVGDRQKVVTYAMMTDTSTPPVESHPSVQTDKAQFASLGDHKIQQDLAEAMRTTPESSK